MDSYSLNKDWNLLRRSFCSRRSSIAFKYSLAFDSERTVQLLPPCRLIMLTPESTRKALRTVSAVVSYSTAKLFALGSFCNSVHSPFVILAAMLKATRMCCGKTIDFILFHLLSINTLALS